MIMVNAIAFATLFFVSVAREHGWPPYPLRVACVEIADRLSPRRPAGTAVP